MLNFQPSLGLRELKDRESQQRYQNMIQALGLAGQGVDDYQRAGRQNDILELQKQQGQREQARFGWEQQAHNEQDLPQGQQAGWNSPGEGNFEMAQGQSGPASPNPLSLFRGGGIGSQSGPKWPQEASAGVSDTPQPIFGQKPSLIDHWDNTMGKQYPHLTSAHVATNYTGLPKELNDAYNNPNMTPRQVSQQEGRYKTGFGFQKEQAEIGKINAEAKKAGSTEFALSEKESQFYQKEWDKIVKDSDPLTATSRSGLGMASRADFNANRALMTLSKPMVTNQEAGNVFADVAQIYQGGSATQYGMSHQGYDTLYAKLQGSIQNLTGNPQDAVPDAIKQRLIGVLQDMKMTNKAVMKQQLDHLERAQPKVIARYKDEWQKIRENLEQGISGGPQQPSTSQWDADKERRYQEWKASQR